MWIKQAKKKNSEKGKTFYQYQLTETYRIEGKVKHKSILYLGNKDLLRDKNKRQELAKLLESRIRDTPALSEELIGTQAELIQLADEYYEKYILKIAGADTKQSVVPEIEYDYVDIASTKVYDSREIGAESMSYKMLERIGLRDHLKALGWDSKLIDIALVSIISRAVACSSEHKTEKWLNQNSALLELFDKGLGKLTRHNLYKASDMLYGIKEDLEDFFYNRLTDMFNMEDKIIIYDLTNTYFEGRMQGSEIARFGRSKEKRYDCKQVVLAAVVNKHGFLKHSRIYEGNMSDPETLSDIIAQLQNNGNGNSNSEQLIVIDAGIATEDNLAMIRQKGLKYVCVSRSKLKDYKSIDITNPTIIKDKNNSEIKLKIIRNENSPDNWMYVESNGKKLKEDSMHSKATERFELEMETVRKGITKKGGTKKIEKVWERIGRIKERNKRVHQYYEIEVKSEGKIVKEIKWNKKQKIKSNTRSGIYFIRTNCSIENESMLWDIYNTIREVESTFRCLKTDLNLRPVYHQKDEHIESHLHLGLLAYQIVAPIRYMLKSKGLNYGWQNIVRIMNTQKSLSVKQKAKENKEIIVKTCSSPCSEALEIYRSLNMSSMPFKTKKFVVPH